MSLIGDEKLPALPEGQDSFAGIPKAVFVVRFLLKSLQNSMNFPKLYNQQKKLTI
jgi:hypothetical protein